MDTFNSVTRKYESIGRQSGSIYSPQTYEIGPIQGFIKILFSSDSSVNFQGYVASLKSLPGFSFFITPFYSKLKLMFCFSCITS